MRKMIKYVAVLFLTVWTVCGCGARSDLVMVPAGDEDRAEETAFFTKEQEPDQTAENRALDAREAESFDDGSDSKQPEGSEMLLSGSGEETVQEADWCYVHVCGAVAVPGVYQLKAGARIFEAIELAGGVTKDGYGDAVNQALKVKDGDRIWIPTREEWQNGMTDFAISQEEKDIGKQEAADSFTEDKININTADVTALCSLPGIGTAKAEAIVAYREANGKFTDISQIQNVTGIKEGLYRKIKDRIKI